MGDERRSRRARRARRVHVDEHTWAKRAPDRLHIARGNADGGQLAGDIDGRWRLLESPRSQHLAFQHRRGHLLAENIAILRKRVFGQKSRDPHLFLERGGVDYLTSCDVPFRHAHLNLFAAKTLERLGARRIDLRTRILQVHKHADSA